MIIFRVSSFHWIQHFDGYSSMFWSDLDQTGFGYSTATTLGGTYKHVYESLIRADKCYLFVLDSYFVGRAEFSCTVGPKQRIPV